MMTISSPRILPESRCFGELSVEAAQEDEMM